jgi:hypothetical protein
MKPLDNGQDSVELANVINSYYQIKPEGKVDT